MLQTNITPDQPLQVLFKDIQKGELFVPFLSANIFIKVSEHTAVRLRYSGYLVEHSYVQSDRVYPVEITQILYTTK